MTSHGTAEQRKAWRLKKLSEDPDYFKRAGKRFRVRHPERAKQMQKQYDLAHPGRRQQSKNDWQRRNKEKVRAKMYANRYVPLKTACEWCDAAGVRLGRHHTNYNNPLDVLTLCPDCHALADKIRKQEGDVSLESFAKRHCKTCAKTWPNCGRLRISVKGRPCSVWEETLKEKLPVVQINNCATCGKVIPETCNRERVQHKATCRDWVPKTLVNCVERDGKP